MRLIKNFAALATTPERKICLELIETALSSIQPEHVIQKNLYLNNNLLSIKDIQLNLKEFKQIFLIGFGKGSGKLSFHLEKMLEPFLTKGYVIDLVPEIFSKIEYTVGSHPLPSRRNLLFTKKVLENIRDLTSKDLVIVVIAGGGSALFANPYKVTLDKLIKANKMLLKSGADITKIVTVRKHIDIVKGGGLAKLLYPARIVALITSDVPGNNLSTIASGPTAKDFSTKKQALEILKKYNLWEKLDLSSDDFLETPKEDMYFENVSNVLILNNLTALLNMQQKAKELGYNAVIYSDKLQREAKLVGKELIDNTPPHHILLAAGETTVKVKGNGKGGRNQELVLGASKYLTEDTAIASFDSDGWDNTEFAGAIGDSLTIKKAKGLNIDPKYFLEQNASFSFFEKIGDGIVTGRLPSNVSDLMIVLRK